MFSDTQRKNGHSSRQLLALRYNSAFFDTSLTPIALWRLGFFVFRNPTALYPQAPLVVDVRWNKIDFDLSTAVYKWLCDHAVFVYAGFEREDGTIAPARPWVESAIAETDVKAIFVREYTRNAGNMQRAWLATVEQLGQRFQDMIMDERWDWDRETVRSDGGVVSSPRDAVDTGELLNSQVIEFEP